MRLKDVVSPELYIKLNNLTDPVTSIESFLISNTWKLSKELLCEENDIETIKKKISSQILFNCDSWQSFPSPLDVLYENNLPNFSHHSLSTGFVNFDNLFQSFGIPEGRTIEILGFFDTYFIETNVKLCFRRCGKW